MEETLEQEGADDDDLTADDLAVAELMSIGQDWDVVTQMLPAQWESKAIELKAVQRLRGNDR